VIRQNGSGSYASVTCGSTETETNSPLGGVKTDGLTVGLATGAGRHGPGVVIRFATGGAWTFGRTDGTEND
jgi:hypothetical protein